jgi:type II secretory pathway component PulF
MNLDEISLTFSRFQFKSDTKTRQRLWKKLSKLLHDGIPIIPALLEIRGLKKPTAPISIAIAEWVRGMENGRKISDVIKPWVSTEESMLLMAGEQSGTLDVALTSVIKVSKAQTDIRASVISGVAYPFFLFILAFCVLYLFGYKIIPAFTKAARGDAWYGVARLMIDVSSFVQNWLHWVAVALVLLIVAFFVSLPLWNSPIRIVLDRYPPYSIYRVMQGSSWLIALSALVQAGVRIESAMEQLSKGASAWGSVRMAAALKGLRSGRNLGESLEKSGYEFPDPEIISDIRIYATKSGFDEALRIIGNEWITESVERIQMLMKLVFGITMMIVGGLIAFVVSGLIAMQLQLTELLQRGVH